MSAPVPQPHRSRPLCAAACAVVVAALLSACASAPPRAPAAAPGSPAALPRAEVGTAQAAVANLAAASATLVSGRIALRAEAGGVRLAGEIGGLTRHGAHVLQVHARGDCSAVDASSAGPYFDATGRGGVDGGSDRIIADAQGVARVAQLVPAAVLGGGAANDIAGRALVVMGATSGATSARVACGVIRLAP
ncbi:superoxide dismutase family protein [Luteimonas sp. MC1572]|uniref:superoxide dismutase family protein n=1 Tax=Luteimonas sp. MC1572 TaxID=2799325 RepID=UPI0018F0A2B7|nr:superoxide dismutase family protein [Luteimonas sp. MC1572]MBJ6982059.1 superoxide dismutase family protein [Luteimonas sp. MC1572]QQO03356.1 superoxide dismutase family protein [Luteimonas sp. MC1572]